MRTSVWCASVLWTKKHKEYTLLFLQYDFAYTNKLRFFDFCLGEQTRLPVWSVILCEIQTSILRFVDFLRPKVAIMLARVRCASNPFSVSMLKNRTAPGSKSPWPPFGRRLRRPCGSPWPTSHFGNVLHRVGEGARLRPSSLGTPVPCGAPKNGGGSFSSVLASP